MDFIELVKRRRSIRRFEERPIEREKIELLLDAALQAPSSKNTNSTRFLVVRDKRLIEHISYMRDFGSAFLRNTPLVILVMGDTSLTDLWVDNCAISATYLQLAAESIGLGSCWVHINGRPRLKEQPEQGSAEEYIRTFLPIPADCKVLCAIALGYPAESPKPRQRPDETGRVLWDE